MCLLIYICIYFVYDSFVFFVALSTGADDLVGRIGVDLSKELGNAIIGMPDNFVTDFFANDEAFKEELGQLDLDGLQMLTDASMLIDPAAEDTFKLDRL